MGLVLASTSPYRRQLLSRLGIPFDTQAPQVDETVSPRESPGQCAQRLADAKANAVLSPGNVVIGGDQIADLDGRALGKPMDHADALAQLKACQGKSVTFHSAVTIAGNHSSERHLDVTRVLFRELPDTLLERYLQLEQPYDCAGSFKVEGLGIRLFQSIESQDPTALIGLPLIWVADALTHFGFEPLADALPTDSVP
ncbi:MAG: Maf family protein [Gammaproteobacteria bacterium]